MKSTFLRTALLPVSWLYGGAVLLRSQLFALGLLPKEKAGAPVISVGNLTAGGTGKTPLVERIVEHLLQRDHRVAVVSRGYGRATRGVVVVSDGKRILVDSTAGGDEPVQIARRCPDAIVVVGEWRVQAARKAVQDLGATVIVLDDGFQHQYLDRDLDILVVDTRKDLIREPLLPAGMRREPMSGIRRADLLAFSKVEYGSRGWATGLRRWYDGPEVAFRHATHAVMAATDHRELQQKDYQGKKVFAFSGIGDHDGFLESLADAGFSIAGDQRFPDHHRFSHVDADALIERARNSDAALLVTTEKDVSRILADARVRRSMQRMPLCYTRVSIEILSGGNDLFKRIDDLVPQAD